MGSEQAETDQVEFNFAGGKLREHAQERKKRQRFPRSHKAVHGLCLAEGEAGFRRLQGKDQFHPRPLDGDQVPVAMVTAFWGPAESQAVSNDWSFRLPGSR